MEALGRLIDIVAGCAPTDAVAGAITGNRVDLKNAGGCTIVLVATGASTDLLQVDVQQATAATGGTIQDLDTPVRYYTKVATTFDGSEVWTLTTQAAASEISVSTSASKQTILVIEVDSAQLSDGFAWLSLNVPDLGSNGTRHCAVLYLLRDLQTQRKPANLVNPNA